MKKENHDEFIELLTATLEIYGGKITPSAISLWLWALEGEDIGVIRGALGQHIKISKFSPKPADILYIIQANDGRPEADAAWALCPLTEADTTVWTDEIRGAFFDAAGLLPDKIAARMAFKSSYDNRVAEARRLNTPAKWMASLGHNQNGREAPLLAAVERGRISMGSARQLLPYLPEIAAPQRLNGPEQIKKYVG